MSDTIKNPTADQLEAGGKISGTYRHLPFEDETLVADGDDLYIGHRAWIRLYGNYPSDTDSTITSYTPPEPKPWWETCPDDTLIEYRIGKERFLQEACYARPNLHVGNVDRNPRRVLVADADTEVIVPRALINGFRDELSRPDTYLTHMLKLGDDLLAAVDERGD